MFPREVVSYENSTTRRRFPANAKLNKYFVQAVVRSLFSATPNLKKATHSIRRMYL